MKQPLAETLRKAGHDVVDFGATSFDAGDDYPDFVIPLAKAVAKGEVARGIAVCGSGVGATVAANKIHGRGRRWSWTLFRPVKASRTTT